MSPLSSITNGYRQFCEMRRLFFVRFLENDLICLDGDTRPTLVGILAILTAPGVFVPFLEYLHYSASRAPLWARDMASIPDKAMYVSFSMTVLGIVTVLEWDALLPDNRDYAVLRPLPIRLGTIFAAKTAALIGFWAVFTLVMNAVPTVLFPAAMVQHAPTSALLWSIRCHALAVVAGSAFVFLAMIAAQAVLMNVLGWRRFRRVAPLAQLLLVAALLVVFFLSLGAAWQVPHKVPAALWRVLPPLWFVGLYQNELGWTQQIYRELAGQACWGLGLAGLIAGAAYSLSYSRSVSRSIEDVERHGAPGWTARVLTAVADRVLLRTPAERASFHFVWQTVSRSRQHRVLVAAYAGGGLALVLQSVAAMIAHGSRTWWQSPEGVLLPVPLVMSLFLLSGMRYAFTVPAELRANWLFQIAESGEPAEYMAGVRKAMALLAIVPLFAALLPLHVAIWGWTAGGLHIAYGATVAWLLMEVLLAGFEKLPFTCSFVPGKANVRTLWPFYVIGYLGYVSLFSALELFLMRQPIRFLWFLAASAAVKTGIEVYRRLVPQGFERVYDDQPEPAVRTLELQQ
ncbi:MAG TPA: hypothetical protein VN442_10980 [Bryobacteraceae bacterium]|nr:hypothetical protein [Bryobacteraceae bacterium]